jgi:hypothetical protein
MEIDDLVQNFFIKKIQNFYKILIEIEVLIKHPQQHFIIIIIDFHYC